MSFESDVCGVLLKDRRSAKKLLQMLGLYEKIGPLTMVNSWYSHVLWRKDDHVMRK